MSKAEDNEGKGAPDSNNATAPVQSPDWTDDPSNPRNWPAFRKWTIIGLLVASNIIAAICSTAFEPALPSLMSSLHSGSSSLASFTISIYSLGYVLGPLFVAPVSEIWGRRYVLYCSFVAYCATLAVCGASKNFALFIVFRAIQGFAGIGFVLLGPAVVADLMPVETRGLSLSVMSAGPVVGPTIGPVIGGYVVEHTTWRWIFWSTLIALGAMFPVALLIFRETYDPVLQARRKEVSEKVTSVRQGQLNIGNALALAWTRPLKLLFLAPIVPLLGLYSAVTHSIAFICFATVGTVFADEYGFGPGQSGMAYFGLTSGFIFCQISLGHFSDWYIRRVSLKHRGTKPEDRLPPIFIGATLLPIGLFWYGWSLEAHTHWIVPIVGSAFIAMGILYTYLPVQMYLVDSYTTFASSATGAATIIRSLCAAVIPLSANPMFQRLGYGWGNSLLAFIALGGVPVALLLIRFGERIRTNPRFQPSL